MGRVHSIESMGLVDGPGIRTVVFFQGCNLRCIYCHNPDTWDINSGMEMSANEIIKKIKRFKPYFKEDGGVTFSGGEPLMQKEFLLELLKGCKAEGIHTCIDTSGHGEGDYREILEYTDLVILDIKHQDEKKYKKIVNREKKECINFLQQVQDSDTPLWIRHVVVPGITDSKEHLRELAAHVKTLKNVNRIELLPFHQLGENKYQELGIKYSLEGIEPMDKELTKELENYFIKESRRDKNE